MVRTFSRAKNPLTGTIHVPGDKSLSHRAVLFSAMAEGETRLVGVLDSADVRSTIAAVAALGAQVSLQAGADGGLAGEIRGWAPRGPKTPSGAIDCGNSGTTARLLMGVLAGYPVEATLTGDESLSRRPMSRVIEPLSRMGASFDAAEGGTLPVTVHGSANLSAIEYESPVASAQVKSAILLAGLNANGFTVVVEPTMSRDHTERLLPAFGVDARVDTWHCASLVAGPVTLKAADEIVVPRDPSSAAFLVVAALLVPGSHIVLPGVSTNLTRTAFLGVLERMGARVESVPWPEAGPEGAGEIIVSYTDELRATEVARSEIPKLIDEVPILALAAACAQGTTRFNGVAELRVKESDRLQAIIDGLTALGVTAWAEDDVLAVTGGTLAGGATLDSLGDHRLAMTWAVAGLAAENPVTVERFEAVDVSYPRFADDLAALVDGSPE
jgi:3-phosphoshikimate 1-carboxyvinyltransferase